MKYLISLFIILLTSQASADISGNIHFTDNYLYRGISNSNNGPAIQGGLDYFNDAGIYAGVWATSMDFQLGADEPSYELDLYGGIMGELASFNWELGYLRFTYPNAPSSVNLDSNEFHLGLSRDIHAVTVAATYHYSPNYSGGGHSHYIETNLDIPLFYEFTLALHAGHQSFERNTWYGLPDYTDWRAAVARDIAGFKVQLGWTDTNINDINACYGGTTWCGNAVSIDVQRNFDIF